MKKLLIPFLAAMSVPLQAAQVSQLELMIINSDVTNIEFIVHDIFITQSTKDRLLDLCQDMVVKRSKDLENWNLSVDKAKTLCYERQVHDICMLLAKGMVCGGLVGAAGTLLLAISQACPVSQTVIQSLCSTTCFLGGIWLIKYASDIVASKRTMLENLHMNAIRIKQMLHNVIPVRPIQ